jgi:CheY-like chemotaxis protein
MKEIVGSRPRRAKEARPLVLYVEDELANFQVAELRLGRTYQLLRAANSRDACRVVQVHRAELYAVLMDVQLVGSDLDGIELAKAMRGHPGPRAPEYARSVAIDVPIIFVTAHGAVLAPEVIAAAGGDSVLFKPVDFMRLMRALTECHLKRAATRSR